jgi:hypothetical protein
MSDTTNVEVIESMDIESSPEFDTLASTGDEGQRKDKFRVMFSQDVVIPVGKLLARLTKSGKSIASVLLGGGAIKFPTVNGLVVAESHQVLRLQRNAPWLCPACNSAHGTGFSVSGTAKEEHLLTNKFYLQPASGHLFAISNHCYKKYVKGQGLDTTTTEAYKLSQQKLATAKKGGKN